jgi:hypothetical protein
MEVCKIASSLLVNSLRAYEPQLSLEVSVQTWLALKVLISVQLALARQDVKEKKRYACWREWNRPLGDEHRKVGARFPAAGQQLVHGAWADGSGWKGVYDILVKDGYNVSIVQEPETSFPPLRARKNLSLLYPSEAG